jgi:PAS domain S-box-containing protein
LALLDPLAVDAPAGPPRVLLVEDELAQRLSMRRSLEAAGFEVVEASSGEGALKVLYTQPIAAAVLDQNLPGTIQGLEVLLACHRDFPLVRVIMATARSNLQLALQALRHGAYDFLEKPVQEDLLQEKVKRAVEAHLLALGKEALLKKYETLFETVPGVVFFVAKDGIFGRFNREGARLLGYGHGELMGRPYNMLLDPVEPADNYVFSERRSGERTRSRRTLSLITKGGEKRIFEFCATAVWDRNGVNVDAAYAGTIGVGWDITERVAMEENMRHAQKMEAIGRLAGGIAHDFNNLLSVINANARLLRADLPADSPLREIVGDVEEAGKHAAQLTRQLLTFSRKEPLSTQAMDLNAAVTSVTPMLRRLLGETVTVNARLCPTPLMLEADRNQFEQLLINLCINARDAMPKGGSVTITTQALPPRPNAPKHWLLMRVEDTGVGMDDAVKEHLFEPFFTTKGPDRGTGLGLAVVYGIVQQHHGHIWADSHPGRGTVMNVELPYDPAMAAASFGTPKSGTLARGRETILVVEDEEMVRRLLRRTLERQGFTVLEAFNGEAGLAVVTQQADNIHLVVTDMVMPVMGGAALVRALQEHHPHLGIIALSGYSVADELRELKTRGVPFLEKPINVGLLLGLIREILDRNPGTRR